MTTTQHLRETIWNRNIWMGEFKLSRGLAGAAWMAWRLPHDMRQSWSGLHSVIVTPNETDQHIHSTI